MQTRRDFGKILLAGVPASLAFAAKIDSTVHGVKLGAVTYCFRDFPRTPGADNVDAIIDALRTCGSGYTELFSANVEPGVAAPQRPAGGRRPGSEPPTPEQQTAMRERMAKAHDEVRQWRLSTPIDHFQAIGKKFDDAGIEIYAYTMNYRNDFTDEEIDKTFEQAKGLGTNIIATSTQAGMMKRLLPPAEKYKINVAFHGHDQTSNAEEFSTPETFQKALDMSKYFKINLDIGHFTAAGGDPVAFIQQKHDQITHLHIKDRKKNHGPNMPFGEGDTPIKEVLVLLRDKKYPIPALIEYEYRGTGTSVEETKKCMDYMRAALA